MDELTAAASMITVGLMFIITALCPCCDCDYEKKEEKELAIYEGMDAKQFQAMELALSRMEKTDRSAALKSRKQAKEAVSAEQWFGAVVRFYQRQLDISSMRFVCTLLGGFIVLVGSGYG